MYPEYSQRPRFMHQLKSRVRTPSNFTTIDAFSVKTKKKTNYWSANQEGNYQSVLHNFSIWWTNKHVYYPYDSVILYLPSATVVAERFCFHSRCKHLSVHREDVYTPLTPPRQTPPREDSPLPPMATAAEGTHPTGMHSSWRLCDQTLVILVNLLGNRTFVRGGGGIKVVLNVLKCILVWKFLKSDELFF